MTYDELLEQEPSDPVHAIGYKTLHSLWKAARAAADLGERPESNFNEWDRLVQASLTPRELQFYLSPYGNLDMNVLDFRAVSRLNHLTKILVHRQGIKTSNGFNG